MNPHESIHKDAKRFYDLKLKATVYKPIEFEEQKEQFCAGLPEEMRKYLNSQRNGNISQVLHHTMVASKLNFQSTDTKGFKLGRAKETRKPKGKPQANHQNSSTAHNNNNNNKANKPKE